MSMFVHQELQPCRDFVPLKEDKWRPVKESKIIEPLRKGLSGREISKELLRRSKDNCCSHYYIMLKKSRSD
jgi:hypothetical protein